MTGFINHSDAQINGFYESYIILNPGTGNNWYDAGATTSNADFNGANLGSFTCGQILKLGGQGKTFKCDPADVTGTRLQWRVWSGSATGTFNSIPMSWKSNDGTPGCGSGQNQTWEEADAGDMANILANLTPGTYTIEIYFEGSATGSGSTNPFYHSNSSNNFKATFTVTGKVHNTTQDKHYCTIQAAVNDANANDVITVDAGTYNEKITVSKSLTLRGANQATCILDGTGLGNGSGITLSNNVTNVTIEKITVINHAGTSPNSFAGIYATGGNNYLTVKNCTLKDNVGGSGFYANGPIDNVVLDYVTATGHTNTFGAARGIVIWNGLKSNITITNCEVYNNNCCGIELQDGTATGVTMTNNIIHDNGDNGIGLVGMQGPGENLIKGNVVENNGRFGIEIKNSNGSGLATGAGRIVVENNTVSRSQAISDLRDIAGIAAFRRGVLPGNVDIPTGVVIQKNIVSGYVQPSTSDGFGIVVEGLNQTVQDNEVSGCDVGIQQQAGNTPYPGDGDQTNKDDQFFGRGNSPITCGNTITSNTLSSNTTDYRNISVGFGIVSNINTSERFCSIQSAINDAETVNGNTLEVNSGTYNEQVIVNKGLTIKSAPSATATLNFSGTVSGKPTLVDVSANNVTIEGLNFNVDLSKLRSAIIASSSGLDAITIKNNTIGAYGTPAGAYGDRNAVSINYSGSVNYRVATDGVDNIVFTGNTVNAGTYPTMFRSGISVDEGVGTFTGNTLKTISSDIVLRFAKSGDVTVSGNTSNGGGMEFSDFNSGTGTTLSITGNTFDGTFANTYSNALRLKNNYTARTTVVSGNTFTGFAGNVAGYGGVLSLENYQAVTVDNNTFTPLANSTNYRLLTVNTKDFSSSSGFYTPAIDLTLTRNTFNGSGTNGGTAIGFYNNDNDSPVFGTFTIGTPGKENIFNSQIATFIYLDNYVGNVNPNATSSVCWSKDLDIRNNKFDVGAGLQFPLAMNETQFTSLENMLVHKPDYSCLGVLQTGLSFWTGNTDSDWFKAGNWTGIVPDETSNAIIPASKPVCEINAAGAVCKDIIIKPSASVAMADNSILSVYGNWTGVLDSPDGKVIFKGDKNQTISFDAVNINFRNIDVNKTSGTTLRFTDSGNLISLFNLNIISGILIIDPGKQLTVYSTLNNNTESSENLILKSNSSVTGSIIAATTTSLATAERFMTSGAWHMIGTPVPSQTLADFLSTNTNIPTNSSSQRGMMDYNSSSNLWNSFFTNTTAGSLSTGKGFAARVADDGIVTFKGNMTSTSQDVGVQSGYWNLICNPYTSALAITSLSSASSKFINANMANFDPSFAAIYVWDNSDSNNGQSGKYSIIGNASPPYNDVQMGQAFFVKAASGASSFSFTPAMRLHNASVTLKSAPVVWPQIELFAAINSNKISTRILFDNSMTRGLDPSYDLGIFKSQDNEIYSKLVEDNGVDFAIQCLPVQGIENAVIPVGLDSKAGGKVVFSAKNLNLPASLTVILEDKTTGVKTSLVNSTDSYTTSVQAGSKGTGRFFIYLSNTATANNPLTDNTNINAWVERDNIVVSGIVAPKSSATLFDASGRAVLMQNLTPAPANRIATTGLKTGIYILKVTHSASVQGFKLHLSE